MVEHYGNGVSHYKNVIDVPQSIIDELLYLRDAEFDAQYEKDGNLLISKKTGIEENTKAVLEKPVRVQVHQPPAKASDEHYEWWKYASDVSWGVLLKYLERYPHLMSQIWWCSRGHTLVYEPDAWLLAHHDNDVGYAWQVNEKIAGFTEVSAQNVVSTTMHLCDSEGGNMVFPYLDNLEIETKAGDVLVFPANYLATHGITPVQEGSKRISYLTFWGQGSHLIGGGNILPIRDCEHRVDDSFTWVKTLHEDFVESSGWDEPTLYDRHPQWMSSRNIPDHWGGHV